MHHSDYSGDALNAARKVAIARCEKENTATIERYENVANTDTQRGLAQQSRRVNELAAFNEAVETCMKRNGWVY
jgi:hypothetical protein